jgi:hypothetical protein
LGIGRLLVEALRPLAVRAGLTGLVYLVDPTNRPALRLLRSLGVELAFRDGLIQGRQRLPRRLLLDASSGSGPAAGQWPCRAGPSARQLPDPHPHRFLDPIPAWEGLRWRESSRGDARHQEDVMHDATAIGSATRR